MMRTMTTPVRFGAQLWSQATDWSSFRDAAVAAERARWDSLARIGEVRAALDALAALATAEPAS